MARKLLLLNGFAILFVTIHHATAYGLQAMFFWTDRYLPVTVPNFDQLDSLAYYVTMTLRQLATFAVPAFLFISGYFIAFLAKGKKSGITWEMVLPRVKILVIPLILWTAIRYILLRHFPTTLHEVFNPYHFIPLLIQFYLLSPFLIPLANNHWKLFLLGAAVIQLGLPILISSNGFGVEFQGQELLSSLTPRWLIPGDFPFWFPFGLVVGLHFQQFQVWLAQAKRTLAVGMVAFGSLAVIEYQVRNYLVNGDPELDPSPGGIMKTLFVLAFLLWFITLDENAIPFSNIFSKLGVQSLGIYLVNIPTVYVVAVLMYHFTPRLLGNQLFYQGILFVVGLGGPLLLMEVVRRSPARRWYRHMFG